MFLNGKVYSLNYLAEQLAAERSQGKKIVHCHGVFDLVHIGHIRYFKQAKNMGDILVVTLTQDRYVNKGPHRPVFDENLRLEAIAALDVVDYVALNEWPMATEAIKLLKPDFYVKGSDYKDFEKDLTGGILLEKAAVESVGGQLAFTDDITFSSSNLLNKHIPVFPREISDFLTAFSKRYDVVQVLGYLEQACNLKVLVIGEAIIDEYVYCETMGKSGKEPILAARYVAEEKFVGGILAIANHVSAFTENVTLLTFLGQQNSHEDFIRDRLNPSIEPVFLHQGNAPTIVKRRFVENYPFQKLFEIYEMNGSDLNQTDAQLIYAELERRLPEYDLVIVADYGHGMIGTDLVKLICEKAPFLAVNTQVNAGNYGFNTITKYHRADYICISGSEIRLEVRDRKQNIEYIMRTIAAKLSCPRILVTQGNDGVVCYSQEEGFFQLPAFTNRIVDRVGAGDSVLAITSLCVVQQAPLEIVGFIGNAVGAEAVSTVGHQRFIEQVPLLRHIETLMK